MKAVPGGQLSIEDIFGRGPFIDEMWRTLETGSVRMEAERRIGKSHILRKMMAEPRTGWEPVLIDLEKVHSAAEFAERVCDTVDARLSRWKRRGKRFRSFLKDLGGSEIGPIKFPEKKNQPEGYWKNLLVSAVEDLVEEQAVEGSRVLFLFDEMPWMLAAIDDRESEHTAMEVLDVLRGLRQSPTTGHGFRMVLCGSIGLHHVLTSLKHRGYRNQPVNDMSLVEVPPLVMPMAAELATRILAGERVLHDPDVSMAIALQTGGFPFYVHYVVSELRKIGTRITRAHVDQVLRILLTTPHDPCSFRHFKDRIATYYPNEERVVLALLDHAAESCAPISQRELIEIAKTVTSTDANRVRELIRLLAADHYLRRDTDSRYSFRHILLRRWWIIEQGLSS